MFLCSILLGKKPDTQQFLLFTSGKTLTWKVRFCEGTGHSFYKVDFTTRAVVYIGWKSQMQGKTVEEWLTFPFFFFFVQYVVATTGFLLCGHPPAELSTSLPSRPFHCDQHLPVMPILQKLTPLHLCCAKPCVCCCQVAASLPLNTICIILKRVAFSLSPCPVQKSVVFCSPIDLYDKKN